MDSFSTSFDHFLSFYSWTYSKMKVRRFFSSPLRRRRYSSLPLSSLQSLPLSHFSLPLSGWHLALIIHYWGFLCTYSRFYGSTAPLNDINSRCLAFTHRLSSSSRGLQFQAHILPSNLQRLQDTSLQTWSNHASIQKESCAVWTRQASPWI